MADPGTAPVPGAIEIRENGRMAAQDPSSLSIIIPFFNEEESAGPVLSELLRLHPGAEIIAVDDGSTDRTAGVIASFPSVTPLFFHRNLGQSAAVYAGLLRATAPVCVMMDGDGQNDPADIPALVAALAEADMACGYRLRRRDSWQRRAASRTANGIRRALLHDGVRDTGCSLKAMRREHVCLLVPFNGLHRFLPAFLRHAGLRIVQVPVNHRPRTRGVSKYTIGGRALRGIRDLLGVRWLLSRHLLFEPGVLGGFGQPAARPSDTPRQIAAHVP
jgi:dolichol-phosphate mannosyltransferase